MFNESDLTTEDLGRKGFTLLQLKDGFRFGTDSVLLAWFAAAFIRKGNNGDKRCEMLELGSNCGAVSLCVAARYDNAYIDAVEIMPDECEVMRMNIKNNNVGNRMRAFNADIRELPSEVKAKQYDVVFMNPPFYSRKNGPAAGRSEGRLNGRFEENGDLDDFMAVAASRVIPSSGHIVMVMHADRLGDVMTSMQKNNIKLTRLMNVHPFEDRNASMILAAGKKGASGSDVKILPPLIISKKTSGGCIINTEKINDIYDKEHTDCFI